MDSTKLDTEANYLKEVPKILTENILSWFNNAFPSGALSFPLCL